MRGNSWILGLIAAALASSACAPLDDAPTGYEYQCGTSQEAAWDTAGGQTVCGQGDPNLQEPQLPTDICQTIKATKSTPDEDHLDTDLVQAALDACKGLGAVKLVADGANNAFVTAHLDIDSVVLWIDDGVTLYASRNPDLYQKTGNCGVQGVNDSEACQDFITVMGASPGIVGDGTIDGQGGEPLVKRNFSWWQLSDALRSVDGSIGNPTLINLSKGTSGFVLYRVTLHDSPKFHVKITSSPPPDATGNAGPCDTHGKGFIVWGVTLLTPSKLYNSQGVLLTPHSARNTDGIDPGTTDKATCGVIACNTVSTSDDQIAIKGGHLVKDVIIAHNHFGTGHGMSIGSETYGLASNPDGTIDRGVQNITVYDLTIDADSRSVGEGATAADFNGIRIKSDVSRGGLVDNIIYRDVCMRDTANAILISTAYNPQFAGSSLPEFRHIEMHDVRHVTCMNTTMPVVTMEGHSLTQRTGPVTLDNVIIDNLGPPSVAAEYADFVLGPGAVNFVPDGPGVTVANNISGNAPPRECVFPTLPAPKLPDGWLR